MIKLESHKPQNTTRKTLKKKMQFLPMLVHSIDEVARIGGKCINEIMAGNDGEERLQEYQNSLWKVLRTIRNQMARFRLGENQSVQELPNHPLILGVEMLEQGVLHLSMDMLLPHSKKGIHYGYIFDAVLEALNNSGIDCGEYNDFVMYFQSVYSFELPDWKMRDFDNMEYSPVINAISSFCLKDDSPLYMKFYSSYCRGDKNATDVYVIPRSYFPEFWVLME